MEALRKRLGDDRMPKDIRIATLFYKPGRNKSNMKPNYFVHESKEWIVFPHELDGLDDDEVIENVGKDAAKYILD